MKIVADRDIPRVAEAFADCGEVTLLPGREIKRLHLRDCRCLIIRTVTRVDRSLLRGSAVEFVGSATIGTDHVDLDYLQASNITFSNAAGCNAEAVSEYVIGGLFALSHRKGFDALGLRAGIVGFGNVGKRLKHKFDALGIECLVCDPPLAESGGSPQEFVELDELLAECNLLSLHTPLVMDGRHPTFHLFDAARLQSLADGAVLINSARGEVVDNRALLDLLRKREDLALFVDTWENEPQVSRQLLRRVDLATPHVAGYSVEGRLRGTQAVRDAAGEFFSSPPGWHMSRHLPPPRQLRPGPADSELGFWQALFREHWDIRRDHQDFAGSADLDSVSRARRFDSLRREHTGRFEYARFRLDHADAGAYRPPLEQLGFEVGG